MTRKVTAVVDNIFYEEGNFRPPPRAKLLLGTPLKRTAAATALSITVHKSRCICYVVLDLFQWVG